MPANVDSMAYYGKAPWHGLGKRVAMGILAKDMIQAAGLDWRVETRPARGAKEINRKGEYSRYEVIRVPRPHSEETEVLMGVVSHRYRPLQNTEAFAFFDPIVGEEKAFFETAGALGQGERVWVMAKMPGAMEIVPGDKCLKYLLLSNTHGGDGSVMVKFTSVRVVCQNTLMLAMDDGQKAYRVRHSQVMKEKLKELAEFLELTQEVFLKAEKCFRHLAAVEIDEGRLEQYIEAVYPLSTAQKEKTKRPQRWNKLKEIFYEQEDLQIPETKGSLWAAYNAITGFEDYRRTVNDELPDQRLERAWFGGGADIKMQALERAKELAAGWS